MDRWKFFYWKVAKLVKNPWKQNSFQIVSENLRDLIENEDSVQGLG